MNIFTRLAELQARGLSAAVCTVTRTSGSVPRRAGAKMLVFPSGRTEGTIGGGVFVYDYLMLFLRHWSR